MAVGTMLRSTVSGALRLLRRAWSAAGVSALVLAAAFLAWRIPTEREEMRVFWQETSLDDGPHILWLDDHRIRAVEAHANRSRKEIVVSEAAYDTRQPQTLPKAIRDLLDERPGPGLPARCEFPETRVLALSDVHGQYRSFVALLRKAGFINAASDWTAGQSHLVIAGDVFDKGPSVTESLWLIRKLEGQAQAAGGRLHFLLGNHDHLALTGGSKAVHYKYRLIAEKLHIRYEHFFSPDSELGRWLRQRNSVVRIGRRIFVHAGFSPRFLAANLSLEEANRLLRLSLDPERCGRLSAPERHLVHLLTGPDGPLWWRGFFDNSFPLGFLGRVRGRLGETESGRAAVRSALARYSADQVVVGHTYTNGIRQLYGGALVALCQNWSGPDLPGSDLNLGYALWEPGKPPEGFSN